MVGAAPDCIGSTHIAKIIALEARRELTKARTKTATLQLPVKKQFNSLNRKNQKI
jgi:CRISPR/Cas system CMR-associated protein Cmr1 (group 7 of RAMP superfamily)